ncbi:antitoxin Xre/MbcA/ParS toxin-binding domain-containing protein [Thiobacillus sp.]
MPAETRTCWNARALKRRYPDDTAARRAWLMLPVEELGGQPPLRVMHDGVEGIKRVRALLEA